MVTMAGSTLRKHDRIADCTYVAVTWKPKTKQKKNKMMKNKNVDFLKRVHLSMFTNCEMIISSQFSYV